jgi:hypothetical protein
MASIKRAVLVQVSILAQRFAPAVTSASFDLAQRQPDGTKGTVNRTDAVRRLG